MSIRIACTVTGSFDHRIVNGAQGAEFLAKVKEILEEQIIRDKGDSDMAEQRASADPKSADHGGPIKALGKAKLLGMYRRMLEIREFEEKIRFLFLEGKMPGHHPPVHRDGGLRRRRVRRPSRRTTSSPRPTGPTGTPSPGGIPMNEMMAELYGKTTGCCRGKGGSMHMGDLAKGMLPAIAIVGGNIPIVTGMALAFKLQEGDRGWP